MEEKKHQNDGSSSHPGFSIKDENFTSRWGSPHASLNAEFFS
jgi:hypothetical protein